MCPFFIVFFFSQFFSKKFFLVFFQPTQCTATVKQNKRFHSTCVFFDDFREFVNPVTSPVNIVRVPGPRAVSPVIQVLPCMPLTISVCPAASLSRRTGSAVSVIQPQVLLFKPLTALFAQKRACIFTLGVIYLLTYLLSILSI